MDKTELSLLGLLVESLIGSPSQFEKVKNMVLPDGNSTVFKSAVEIIEGIAAEVAMSMTPTERANRLRMIARKLSLRSDEATRSVGEALSWALDSSRGSRTAAS